MNQKEIMKDTDLMLFPNEGSHISFDLLDILLTNNKISNFSKVLLLRLVKYKAFFNNFFISYPSHELLMKEFNVNITTIFRSIKELKDSNIIYVIYDKNGRSYKRKNYYLILPYLCTGNYKEYLSYMSKRFSFDKDDAICKVEELISYKKSLKLTDEQEELEEKDNLAFE